MSGDAQAHLVDLDDALITWAMDKLGSDYTVEKVDASKVHPPPNSLPLICLPAQLQGPEGRRLQGLPPASLSPTIYCPTTHFPPHPSTRSRRSSTPPKYARRRSRYRPRLTSLPPTCFPIQLHGREGRHTKACPAPISLPPTCLPAQLYGPEG